MHSNAPADEASAAGGGCVNTLQVYAGRVVCRRVGVIR